MNTSISVSRAIKKHWRISLAAFIAIFALGIVTGFVYFDNIAIPLTLIGVLPPSVYYFYSEALNRPLVVISNKDDQVSIAPMYAGIEDGSPDFIRPAIFHRFQVENQGKSTAERARVEVRLEGNSLQREFYARWSGPANSDEYDLLPGQKRDVMILKIFLTTDFYERLNGLKEIIEEESEISFDNQLISPPDNPPGKVRELEDLESYLFTPVGYTPREQRPERAERSIHGGWEGQEISIIGKNIQDEMTINARVVADNYRTDWAKGLETVSFISLIRTATDDQYWQQQWKNQGLNELKNRIRIKMQEWLKNHSDIVS